MTSIGLGEDGPTHQPVEHLAALRAIPNLKVFRPCDAVETVECWQLALQSKDGPSVLALTRQNLPQLRLGFDEQQPLRRRRLRTDRRGRRRGGGFAVRHRLGSRDRGRGEKAARRAQDLGARRFGAVLRAFARRCRRAKRAAIIGEAKVNVAVEAGIRQGWDAIIGSAGAFVGMTGFGASAPYKDFTNISA